MCSRYCMATICMSYNLILYRANYFVLREHIFVFTVFCAGIADLFASYFQ